MASNFTYNPAVEQQILHSPPLRMFLGAKAQRVADIAIETAPVGEGPQHDARVAAGEDYKSNIGAGIIEVGGRPAGWAYAAARHSVILEFGTYKMEPRATLRRALESGGRT